jgi:hypothetical protein
MRIPRPSLSYANVTATLALFVALGGVSWAAIELPARSVGSAQLRDGAVNQRTLSKQVRRKLEQGRGGERGPAGAPGQNGERGPQGERGPAGSGAVLAPGSITGVEIDESTLGKVPVAAQADRVGGLSGDELMRGPGRLWSHMVSTYHPHRPETGEAIDISLALFPRNEPDGDLMFMVRCMNEHPSLATGAQPRVWNRGAGPAHLWLDDGETVEYAEIAPRHDRAIGEAFQDAARRVIIQGVSSHGDVFVSVVASHDADDGCRAGLTGVEAG